MYLFLDVGRSWRRMEICASKTLDCFLRGGMHFTHSFQFDSQPKIHLSSHLMDQKKSKKDDGWAACANGLYIYCKRELILDFYFKSILISLSLIIDLGLITCIQRRKNGLTEEDIASVQLPQKPDSLYKVKCTV